MCFGAQELGNEQAYTSSLAGSETTVLVQSACALPHSKGNWKYPWSSKRQMILRFHHPWAFLQLFVAVDSKFRLELAMELKKRSRFLPRPLDLEPPTDHYRKETLARF